MTPPQSSPASAGGIDGQDHPHGLDALWLLSAREQRAGYGATALIQAAGPAACWVPDR